MHIRRSTFLLASLIVLARLALADPPELLLPVDGAEEARLIAQNRGFLEREAYFAKRNRIVAVNTDLLLEDNLELSIRLFDDVRILATRTSISLHDMGENFTWRGRYAMPPFSLDEFLKSKPDRPRDEAERLYGQLFDIQIGGTEYVFDGDPSTAEGVAEMRLDPSTGHYVYGSERLAEKRERGISFYSVRFGIRQLTPKELLRQGQGLYMAEYVVRSLPMDRRYNVVLEIDPQKIFALGDNHTKPNPEQLQRAEEYRKFLDSLENATGSETSVKENDN